MSEPAIQFDAVDIVFGKRQKEALAQLDSGADRAEILAQTDCVLGVADANLSIDQGQISVLMGLSGSGKSTLLRCVNGLNRPTRGTVRVADGTRQIDIGHCPGATLRRLRRQRISMVFQQFALLPWRTVAENVGLGLELRGIRGAALREAVDEKLHLVGLDRWRERRVDELSDGMQQRVGLARAFATDADILLMDEPFSALDPLIRQRLQNELLSLQQTLNKTILFVSHDLDEAMRIGNQIAIMDDGRIVQHGAPEAIVLHPANEYVADFVAHMNPLDVLRGRSIMTPVRQTEEWIRIDQIELFVDASGRAATMRSIGSRGSSAVADHAPSLKAVDAGTELDHEPLRGVVAIVDPEIPLRQALRIRQISGHPLVLADHGRVVGTIGENELFGALLGARRGAH